MKICGIVAEYNPFHNGHKYQINKVKEEFGADGIVAVMSGNFIQRGLPALFDKWTRAKMALQNGVDLVIELPTYYAVSSAEYFATGAVSILNSLGVINDMCFGASTTDIDTLKRIANVLFLEPEGFKKLLRSDLKRGASFPIARSNALKNFLKKKKNPLSKVRFLWYYHVVLKTTSRGRKYCEKSFWKTYFCSDQMREE